MSYLAIARKYRPDRLGDIVGQEHVTQTLVHAIERDRIHHAYLFCGARGVGKTTAARALALALNCVNGPTATPCGTCASCTGIAAGSSPDLIEIDGASNNGVENIRDLRDTVHYAPVHGKRKIYLVDEVHMLSKAAFNALLKTLEEPPAHVVFLFATTEPHRILDTILSRLQRFDFKRLSIDAVVERLRDIATREGAQLSDDALRHIARAGDGSMRDAESLLDKVIGMADASGHVSDEQAVAAMGLIDRTIVLDFIEALLQGRPATCLERIQYVYELGHEISQFSADLLQAVRDCTLASLSDNDAAELDVSPSERARLVDIANAHPPTSFTRLFHALLDTHDKVSRAERPRIVLEMAVAHLAHITDLVPLSELTERLEAMEARLGRKPTPTPPPKASPSPRRPSPPSPTPPAASAAARAAARPAAPPAALPSAPSPPASPERSQAAPHSAPSPPASPERSQAASAEDMRALRRQVLEEPGCRRIIEKLGGKLETVTPLGKDAP